MSSSELTELSSSPLSEDDIAESIPKGKLEHYFKQGLSALPPKVKKKRPPSPPHEYVLADNPDIAFICMFRSRFSDCFPKSLPHYGPQDIERGVVDSPPGEHVERLLCALIGLLLNRKKEVEKGHYSRALEEAVQTHSNQWATKWEGKNPLHGGSNFNNMSPEQRLTLLRTLIMWCLDSSDAVKSIIKESYKQARHDDDLNQPLSVQPWGFDGDKRRFWLIEGQDDTHFRLYRESNPALKHNTWRSVAGSIEEVKSLATQLTEDHGQAGRRLSDRIMAAIPRFEASEEKRKRRDYRIARRAQFSRPEPGFSLYEGRTRGKRIKYTYSDDEDAGSDVRRSGRQSGVSTPAEPTGPTYTASGRQVRARHGGAYGETILSGQHEDGEKGLSNGLDGAMDEEEDAEAGPRGRSSRATIKKPRGGKHIEGYNSLDEMEDESEASSSGNEWDGDDEPDDQADDEDEDDEDEMGDEEGASGPEDDSDEGHGRRSRSLLVSLRYSKIGSSPSSFVNGTSTPDPPNANSSQPKDQGDEDMDDVTQDPRPLQSTEEPYPPPNISQKSAPSLASEHPSIPYPESKDLPASAQPNDALSSPHAFVFDQKPLVNKTEPAQAQLNPEYPTTQNS